MRNASRADAVLLNTFDDLETEVLDAIREKFDTVATIGPLQLLEKEVESPELWGIRSSLWKEDDSSIAWLDGQAPNSVLYMNFGSITVLSPEQLLEFMWGLANSGQHFLWIIRPDLVSGEKAVLPEEVTALSEGVPMICWPFFAEQHTNYRYACRDWGVGMEIEGVVTRQKVAEVVKVLMEGEKGKGKGMRKKALEWKNRRGGWWLLRPQFGLVDQSDSAKKLDWEI
ncbi:hypothetical protein SASPL_118542 [Salvia splendens]|uniref:Uncharacterized protein n=1 Tax=Salvia splendens TaxID=180675 RepID=A0A8X8ZXB9_SALSN|nr:hypothetical protein SASPL_118542 [Salvia splendens]